MVFDPSAQINKEREGALSRSTGCNFALLKRERDWDRAAKAQTTLVAAGARGKIAGTPIGRDCLWIAPLSCCSQRQIETKNSLDLHSAHAHLK